jgi:hypothetical protein
MTEDAPTKPSGERYGEAYCKTLNDYHAMLWGRQLLNLTNTPYIYGNNPPSYRLLHVSKPGLQSDEFTLTSDILSTGWNDKWGLGSSYKWLETARSVLEDNEIDEYGKIIRTIGNYIVFPKGTNDNAPNSNGYPQYDRTIPNTTWGINSARGLDDKIRDRFDLTLECIRLWYDNVKDVNENPLINALDYSKNFLSLFGSGSNGFKKYVEHFLLEDLVDSSGNVKFFLPFSEFVNIDPLPRNIDFRKLMDAVKTFISGRNQRIDEL